VIGNSDFGEGDLFERRSGFAADAAGDEAGAGRRKAGAVHAVDKQTRAAGGIDQHGVECIRLQGFGCGRW